MKKHFVEFFSPGTFISETTIEPIDFWNVEEAKKMSKNITERYNAKPYGFRFLTKSRTEDDLDSKVTEKSPMYFLGGRIFTLKEIKEQNNPDNNILIFNMKCNNIKRVIENTNSWKITLPFGDDDILLEMD